MKALIHNIIPHYIEYDLLDHGGKKEKQTRILKEYFELSEQLIITGHHRPYSELFTLLQDFYTKYRTLRANNISLYLEEKNSKCFIWLIRFDEKQQKRKKLFCQKFPREEWANIEELFLKAGLKLQARYIKQIITFKYPELGARYTLLLEDKENTLCVEVESKDDLIQALTIVGYSIDQVEIIENVE